ncbi:protein FANTASTIC FOUR 1-like [Camellia sinensis]|nr:protein FANTASTIC FOUR 1-like [Camellia sinensis]
MSFLPSHSITFLLTTITIMINFCVKSVHSLLNFANSKDNNNGTVVETPPRHHCQNLASPVTGGLSFVALTADNIHRPTNVVESSAVKSPSPPSSPSATTAAAVKIGFLDKVGGSVDGLMLCTESLGFESSDEWRVDDKIENISDDVVNSMTTTTIRPKRNRMGWRSEVKNFPPPLSSMNQNGKPIFYLRPVRRDGRLELMEVKIERLEVLRASREDGRLRLHLIRDADVEEEEQVEEEGKIEEVIEEEGQVEEEEEEEEIEEAIEEEEEEEEEEKEKEEEVSGKWVFPVKSGGGDGFRRCHELVHHHHHHHHHHNLHGWSQHSVTI